MNIESTTRNTNRPLSFQSKLTSRKGMITVLLAVTMAVCVGMVAFSVDLGFHSAVKAQMRAAADAAALAAAGALVDSQDLEGLRNVAVTYGNSNVPSSYGEVLDPANVTFGRWDPVSATFTPDDVAPDAVRVVVRRAHDAGNAVPYFFGTIYGKQHSDMEVAAIACGAVSNMISESADTGSVYVTSSKDLSNVVLQYEDGSHQKFERISGYTGTFAGTGQHAGKTIVGVWVKSGCNASKDGSGYGEYFADNGDGTTMHGRTAAGCTPHVTATFEASGVTFTESGSHSPVRLVQ